MKNKSKKIFNIIFFISITLMTLILFTNKSEADESEAHEFSYKLNIDSKMIYRVTPKTDYSVLLENMKSQITGEEDTVELYENGNKVTSGIVKTGMTLVRNSEENYDVAVLGDITKDGIFDQRDLSGFIRHYIGLSEFVLTGKAELKSTDINNDEEINIIDISSIIMAIVTESLPEDTRPEEDKPKTVGKITLTETDEEGNTTEICENGITITGEEDNKTIAITNPSSGEVTATSSDETVATVSIEDGVLIIIPKGAGTAEITIKVGGTDEYTPAKITIIITIQKAEGSITLDSTSGTTVYPNTKTVGITNPSGGALSVISSDSTIATGSISGNTLTITPKKAGTATITVTSAATSLYTSSSATYEIIVENSSDKLMLSETSGTTTYPNNKTVTITNPSGGTLSTTSSDSTVATGSISGNTLTITPKKAGTATITVNSAAAAGYNASSATYEITVQKAAGSVTLGAASGTTTYPTAKTTTITNPNGATLSATSSDSTIATGSISGNTLTITPKKSGTTTITVTAAATEQYTSSSATYSITVQKATGSVSLSSTSGTTTYPNNKTATITNPNGASLSVSSSNSSIATGSISGNTLTITPKKAGTATITVTAATTEQYTSATATYSITINKAAGQVTAPTPKTGLTYTGSAQTLINAGSSTTGTMYYKLEGGTYSTSLPTATNVGIYKVYYYSKGDANHNDTTEGYITVKIAYETYAIGDTITLGTGANAESFYVIEASDSLTSTVKLITQLNVETTNYTQSSSANTVEYNENGSPYKDAIYEDSTIKTLVDTYKTRLQTRTGKTIQDARLMLLDEANYLKDNGYTSLLYGTNPKLDYWLGTPHKSITGRAWGVYGSGSRIDYESVDWEGSFGVRPVIVIYKPSVEKIVYDSYAVGDVVTLGTGSNTENFYVIEASNSSTSTVKLITQLNVETTNYTQSSSASTVEYNENGSPYKDAIYEDSTIKTLVDTYKTRLQTRTEKTIQDARLMLLDEANYLKDNGYTSLLYGTDPKLDYWLGSYHKSITGRAWGVYGSGSRIDYESVDWEGSFGVRPVIVIDKFQI